VSTATKIGAEEVFLAPVDRQQGLRDEADTARQLEKAQVPILHRDTKRHIHARARTFIDAHARTLGGA
jgi:hypothetical protein